MLRGLMGHIAAVHKHKGYSNNDHRVLDLSWGDVWLCYDKRL